MSALTKKYTPKELKDLSSKMNECPFCGARKSKITSISKGAHMGNYYQGLCNVCFGRGPKSSDAVKALNDWNKRYFGNFEPLISISKKQLKRMISNSNIVVRCKSQEEFNAFLKAVRNITVNVSSSDWCLWGEYKEDTCVRLDDSSTCGKKCFGYQDLGWFKESNFVIEEFEREQV